MSAADLGIAFGRVAFVMLFVLNMGGLLTWVERKQSAIMQDRAVGPDAILHDRRLLALHPREEAAHVENEEHDEGDAPEGDAEVGHGNGDREPGPIGGWPDTRCDPAAPPPGGA